MFASFERVEEDAALAAAARPRRALAIRGSRLLVDARTRDAYVLAGAFASASDDAAFLGLDERGLPLHVLLLADADDDAALARLGLDASAARFVDPRMELGRFAGAVREAVLTALALARWSEAERFCSRCAEPLRWDAGGRTKTCANPSDAHRHFPRTDPATIVLVSAGERVLLGRQATWPAGLYSTLAGFVEPGETLESSVAREVFEEAGIRVTDVRYAGSESWPFPRSLMLGFTARATSETIALGDELEDARWFSRAEASALQAAAFERMPYFDTIARRLIRAWLAAGRDSVAASAHISP